MQQNNKPSSQYENGNNERFQAKNQKKKARKTHSLTRHMLQRPQPRRGKEIFYCPQWNAICETKSIQVKCYLLRIRGGVGGGDRQKWRTPAQRGLCDGFRGAATGLDIKMKMPHIKFIQLSKRPICRL